MDGLVPLLDHAIQAEFRSGLAEQGFEGVAQLRDEDLAALAILGRQSPEIRRATLTVLPLGIRRALSALRLVADGTESRFATELTEAGEQVAQALAARAPDADPATLKDARANVDRLLAEVRQELGPVE